MSLFDDVKSNLVEWYGVTSDKTTEVARVSARRYDKFGISRDIERQFSELGSIVYNGLKAGADDTLGTEAVRHLVERISELEAELRLKDNEIDDIRQEYSGRKTSAAGAEGMSATVITDPILGSGDAESAIIIESVAEENVDDER